MKLHWNAIRLIFNPLKQEQVNSLNTLTDYISKNYPTVTKEQFAYILATIYHETGHKMIPCEEKYTAVVGKEKYFNDMYDLSGKRPRVAKTLGNTVVGDGLKYRGRGLVQITGKYNYATFSKLLNIDFVKFPEKTLELDLSIQIAVIGMVKGSFRRGNSLATFTTNGRFDAIGARGIINAGGDRALDIKQYYETFLKAII